MDVSASKESRPHLCLGFPFLEFHLLKEPGISKIKSLKEFQELKEIISDWLNHSINSNDALNEQDIVNRIESCLLIASTRNDTKNIHQLLKDKDASWLSFLDQLYSWNDKSVSCLNELCSNYNTSVLSAQDLKCIRNELQVKKMDLKTNMNEKLECQSTQDEQVAPLTRVVNDVRFLYFTYHDCSFIIRKSYIYD